MSKVGLVGNNKVKDFLYQSYRQGKLGHAYLLRGPKGIGKSRLVLNFLQQLMCQQGGDSACASCQPCLWVEQKIHPDVWWVGLEADKQEITIEQVRELQQFTKLGSLSGGWRAVVIEPAEDMSHEAANALLKVLEEPPLRTIFFLLSHESGKLLPTINSRCFVLHCNPVSISDIVVMLQDKGLSNEEATRVAQLASGRPAIALDLADNPELENSRLAEAQIVLNLFRPGSWNEFQKTIAQIIKDGLEGDQSNWQRSLKIIDIWLEVVRDLLLTNLGLVNLVHYQVLIFDLKELSSSVSLSQTVRVISILVEAKHKLQANAQVRLTMEWVGAEINATILKAN